MTEATDCQLLERFVTQHDEDAFTTLVHRHAALGLGVCRRVLGDEHDAQDVFQATLVILARKAMDLGWHRSVGPWLSAVAYRLALNARAARQRRQRSTVALAAGEESWEPMAPGADVPADVARREVTGVVREEIARLPEKYRDPVVLCY